jgi:polysaccharide deacetylase family protein (PEP-CTERM system associated)
MRAMPTHALTIDLEDWSQLLGRRLTGVSREPLQATVSATHRLLDALDEAGVRATFFVVGMLAERFPELVGEVHRRGHEIGSHTYTHRLIFNLTREEFRDEMRRSKEQLESLTGTPVRGFRAPEFSVGALDHWCFDVLAELGFGYDSSVFPIRGSRYGIADAPHEPFRIETASGGLWEFPLATYEFRGRRIPVAGGSYFRLLPQVLLRRAIADLDRQKSGSVFYFHPYEFTDETLRLEGVAARTLLKPAYVKYRLLHNFRTARILRNLKPVLTSLQFRPLGEICSAMGAGNH